MSKNSAEEKQQAAYRAALDKLLQEPENKFCADCRAAGARWASPKLGIFICMKCAGIHRGLGVHISFVRSVTLDKWKESEVQEMTPGNSRSAAIYEANLPENFPRPSGDSIALEKFIRNKYVDKKYMGSPKAQPPSTPQQTVSQPAPRSHQPEMSPPSRRAVVPGRQVPVTRQPAAVSPQAQSPQPQQVNLFGDLNFLQPGAGTPPPQQLTQPAAPQPTQVDPGLFSGQLNQNQQQAAAKNDIKNLLAQPTPTQPQFFSPQVFPVAAANPYPMAAGFQYPPYYQQQPQATAAWGYAPVQPDTGGLEILNKIHTISQENRGSSPGLSQVYF
jgi:stromal membrane-associated protein